MNPQTYSLNLVKEDLQKMSKQQILSTLYSIISQQDQIIQNFYLKIDSFNIKMLQLETKYKTEVEFNEQLNSTIQQYQKQIKSIKTQVKLTKSENIVLKSRLEYHDEWKKNGSQGNTGNSTSINMSNHKNITNPQFLQRKIKKISICLNNFLDVVENLFTGNQKIQNQFLQQLYILKENLK